MGRAMLLTVSGVILIFGLIQRANLQQQEQLVESNVQYHSRVQTQNMANAAADAAIAELNQDFSWNQGFDNMEIMGGHVDVTLSNPSTFEVLVTAIASYQNDTDTTEILLRRSAFSKYSYFTDQEPLIYFATGDTLNGPVHTNDTFNMQGEPVFNGEVTSPNEWDGSGYNGSRKSSDQPHFNKGSNFAHESIDMPMDVPDLVSKANNGGLRFDNPIKIEFHDDGTANIREGEYVSGHWTRENGYWDYIPAHMEWDSGTDYNMADYNGVISSSEKVQVKGEFNGVGTLHSEEDIEIMGDLKYADNPEDNDNSDDLLGIVSEGNAIVDEDAHESEGYQDVTIQASIMTMNGSFEVEDYNDGESRGQLHLYGGLIQQTRGPVGLVTGSGYLKHYSYDERFLDNTTPGFPRENLYSIVYWKEE